MGKMVHSEENVVPIDGELWLETTQAGAAHEDLATSRPRDEPIRGLLHTG